MALEERAQKPLTDLFLFSRLKWSLFFRIAVTTIILLSILGFQIRESHAFFVSSPVAIYILIGFSYFFTLISLLVSYRIRRLRLFSYTQVSWEVFFATALVYLTGYWDSMFAFLYVLAIIIASLILFRTGAFFSATASSLLYGIQIFGVKYSWLPALFAEGAYEVSIIFLLQHFFYRIFFFYTAAILSSYLTEQLRQTRKELSEVKLDFGRLEVLNEAIVHSINAGLVTLDSKGKIIFLNRSGEKILGKKITELIGKSLSEILPGELSNALLEASRKATRCKFAFTNFQKQELMLDCSWQKLQNPGDQPLGDLLVLSDITELEKMEERLRASDRLAAVGKLAAGIAHEIRNPLGAISGSIELLKKELDLSRADNHLMEIVLNETDRLNKLITDFLFYARPAPKTIQPIQVAQLFQNLLEMLKTRVNSQVELVLKMEPDMIIYTDPMLIEQIFWNLVNNSLEAMPGGGKLEIQGGKETREPRPGIWLSFRDTGTGIPAENLDKIFDPFFTTKPSGTGLGLSTIWRIVQELEGEISGQSKLGQGVLFKIWLPEQAHSQKTEQGK